MAQGSKPVIDFNDYVGGEEAIQGAARNLRDLGKEVDKLSKLVVDDSGRIKAAFAGIEQAAKALRENGGSLNLATDADKRLLADYLKQASELTSRKAALKEAAAAEAAAVGRVTEAYKQQSAALKEQKDALRTATTAGDVEGQRKAAAAIRQNATETKQLGLALRGVNSEFTAAKGSYDALTIANGKLLAQLRGLEGGLDAASKEAQELRSQISANTATLTGFDKQLGQSFRNVGNYPQSFKAVGAGALELVQGLAGVTLGLSAVTQGLQTFFSSNVEYSRNLAEVRKTTGLTADEANRLAESLKALDTPTSIQGLLKIATVGGQLGVAKEDLLGFTKAIDTAVQALGNDFTGGAEEIATVLGKIGSVYRKELGPDVAKNILNVGSAVNQLGADGAATAPFLTDVALRVGAISSSTGVGLNNVLAYASVLQETGSTSEVAGTALNKFFSTLTTKTKEAYNIAKLANPALTLKEFTHLVNTDFNQAIQVFLKGLREGGKSSTDQARLLGTLKLQSGEARSAIITLAQNTELFAARQATANQQLKDGTSLAAEAAVQSESLGGKVDKLTNTVSNLFTSGAAGDFLGWLVDIAKDAAPGALRALAALSTFGISEVFRAASVAKKAREQAAADANVFTGNMLKQALAARDQAKEQAELQKSYEELSKSTNRSADDELRLSQLRGKIIQQIGTDDAAALQKSIDNNNQRVEAARATYARYVGVYSETVKKAAGIEAAAQNEVNEQAKKLSADQLKIAEQVAKERAAGAKDYYEGPEIERAIAAITKRNKAEKLLTEQQQQLRLAQEALAKLVPASVQAARADGTLTEEQTKKKRGLADALKAELELQKQRLELLAKDYDRQAENVANSDEVRVRAVEKAVAVRKQIAKLDELEQIHESERKNAKLIDGERAISADTIRITEATQAKVAELDRNGLRAIVAIKQAGADQLAEIDKARLADEITALERLSSDESKSAQERQQALIEAANKRVEIIKLEAAEKRRAAKYDAEVLRKIQLDEDNATASELRKVRSYNADLTNADLDKTYKVSQLLLEKDRAAGLLTEKQYNAEREKQEIAFLEGKLANLKKDLTKQQEAADLEVDINRRKNDKKVRDDEETRQKRLRIIDKVSQYAQFGEDSLYQIKANFLDAQAQQEQQAYEASLAAAGDNAALKTQIEKDHQKELKRINFEKAKQEREAALYSILLSTATAVAKDLATYGFLGSLPFIAGDFAIGAVQTAVALSKPLPQYFKGRKGGPAEWAEVAERGPEIISNPTTGRFIYQSERAIVPLGAGDAVHTASETSALLAALSLSRSQADRDPLAVARAFSAAAAGARATREAGEGPGNAALLKGQQDIVRAIKEFKPTQVNVHKGSEASVGTSTNLTHWMNQRMGKKS